MPLDRLQEGLLVSAIGITVVITFLILLVFMTIALGRFARRFETSPVEPTAAREPATDAVDPRTLAAIAAAVRLHRTRHASTQEAGTP